LEDFGPDWETELKFVFKEGRLDVNWINGAEDVVLWRLLIITIMNFSIS